MNILGCRGRGSWDQLEECEDWNLARDRVLLCDIDRWGKIAMIFYMRSCWMIGVIGLVVSVVVYHEAGVCGA